MGRPSSIGVVAWVLICIALLIATSGCGAGGSSATTAAQTTRTVVSMLPTRAHFARQLAALCSAAKQLAGNQKVLTNAIEGSDLKEAGEVTSRVGTEAGTFYRRFVSLTPSAQDRAMYVRYLSLTHQYLGINARLAAALHAHILAEVHRFGGYAQKVADQRTTSAAALGLGKCGGHP